jgi:hypothetical protein
MSVGYFDDVRPQRRETPLRAVPSIPAGGNVHAYAAAALRGEAGEVAGAPEGTRNDALNRAWFRMGRHIGAGSIDVGTVREALTHAARTAGLPDHEIAMVLRDDTTSGLAAGFADPRHPTELETPGVTVLDVPELDADAEHAFWTARPLLHHLHTFARARRVSPWAVLGVALARVVTATPHQVCLPPIVGGKASLNLFVGLVGPSGSGKGAAEAVAADALSVGYITSHNVGSGEGIAHGYMHRVKGGLEWNDETHAVLFSVPEIDSLAAQGDRRGATLMPQLRSGWTGEMLGFGYADPTKRIIVPAHEYRLCLVAGIQPGRAACLLDDADGGTPQRFLWLPATDREAPDRAPEEPHPLTWQAPRTSALVGVGGIKVDVCYTARETITANRLARLRGEGDALDGHALLAQLKTAAALGIADGRYSVTDEDWELAGVIARKSAAVRAGVQRTLSAKAAAANEAKGEAEAARAVHVAERVTDAAIQRVCRAITRKLRAAGDWTPRAVLRRGVPARDRQHFDDALDRLTQAGQIEVDETATGHGNTVGKYRIKEGS